MSKLHREISGVILICFINQYIWTFESEEPFFSCFEKLQTQI